MSQINTYDKLINAKINSIKLLKKLVRMIMIMMMMMMMIQILFRNVLINIFIFKKLLCFFIFINFFIKKNKKYLFSLSISAITNW
jgi:hypothetical protein